MSRTLLLLIVLWGIPQAHSQTCPSRLLVSGYTSANVHLFDPCTGDPLSVLDSAGRLVGAQATRLSNGLLYVASEENAQVVRYRADTLAFVDVLVDTRDFGITLPTALAFGPNGDLYIGGFQSNRVVRVDPDSGVEISRFDLGGLIGGLDAGMIVDQQGRLLVPGFSSDNIAAIDLTTGAISEFVPAGTGNLASPRVIVEDLPRNRLLVTSWGGNRVVALSLDGALIGDVINVSRPTGLLIEADGNLLVTSDQVARVNRYSSSGEFIGLAVNGANNGVVAATFLTALVDSSVIIDEPVLSEPDQAWLIGAGTIEALTLNAEMVITDGTAFGTAFDPDDVRRIEWGNTGFEVIACDRGLFSWQSPDQRYDQGMVEMVRLASNPAQSECELSGLSQHTMIGTWFAADRSGEGIAIDVLNNGQGVLTWYTYRPVDQE